MFRCYTRLSVSDFDILHNRSTKPAPRTRCTVTERNQRHDKQNSSVTTTYQKCTTPITTSPPSFLTTLSHQQHPSVDSLRLELLEDEYAKEIRAMKEIIDQQKSQLQQLQAQASAISQADLGSSIGLSLQIPPLSPRSMALPFPIPTNGQSTPMLTPRSSYQQYAAEMPPYIALNLIRNQESNSTAQPTVQVS